MIGGEKFVGVSDSVGKELLQVLVAELADDRTATTTTSSGRERGCRATGTGSVGVGSHTATTVPAVISGVDDRTTTDSGRGGRTAGIVGYESILVEAVAGLAGLIDEAATTSSAASDLGGDGRTTIGTTGKGRDRSSRVTGGDHGTVVGSSGTTEGPAPDLVNDEGSAGLIGADEEPLQRPVGEAGEHSGRAGLGGKVGVGVGRGHGGELV